MHMTAPVQEADQLMPMMLASLGGHLPMMLASLLASVKEVAQLMRIMLASFAGTCQTKVHLMQVMLGPADAGDARFFGGGACGGGERAGEHLPSGSPLECGLSLGRCSPAPIDADDAR